MTTTSLFIWIWTEMPEQSFVQGKWNSPCLVGHNFQTGQSHFQVVVISDQFWVLSILHLLAGSCSFRFKNESQFSAKGSTSIWVFGSFYPRCDSLSFVCSASSGVHLKTKWMQLSAQWSFAWKNMRRVYCTVVLNGRLLSYCIWLHTCTPRITVGRQRLRHVTNVCRTNNRHHT